MAPLAALALFACAPAPVREITPISTSVRGQSMVSDVDVKLSPLALEAMTKFEEKPAPSASPTAFRRSMPKPR